MGVNISRLRRGNFEGNGRPIVKYTDIVRSPVQKGWSDRDAVWVWVMGLDGPKELCVR